MSGLVNLDAPLATADFDAVTSGKRIKKKRPSPLSIRLSPEQRRQLEQDAQGMALNAYVIGRLFKPRRKRHLPTKQEKAIAGALRRLGHAGIATYMVSQIVAQEEGRLMLSPEEEKQLRHAYSECDRVRRELVATMGLTADYSDA